MSNLDLLDEHLRKREWVQLDREAKRLALLEHLTTFELGRVLRARGRAKIGMSEFHAAIKLTEQALPHALKARDWDTLGFARADLGALNVSLGDNDAGSNYLQAYLLDVHRYTDAQSCYGKVRFNLALAHKYRRRYPEAIEQYEAAIEWFTLRGITHEKAMAHQNLSWLLCTIGRVKEAKTHLEIADTYREVSPPDFEAEQLCCWAFYFWTVRQVGSAINYVQEVLLPKRPGVTTYHRGQASLIGARVAILLNQETFARRLLQSATDAAVECGDPALGSDCSRVRAEILAKWSGDQEAAE